MSEAASKDVEPIRVLIVDDHLSVLWGLERLIESSEKKMVVVGKATDARGALQQAGTTLPDVILLDIGLPDGDGIDLIPQLIAACPNARILVLTGERSAEIRDRAILAGACGVVRKEEVAGNILLAVAKVHAGELWLDRASTGRVFMQLARGAQSQTASDAVSRLRLLTPRERHIAHIVAGQPSLGLKVIAASQHISESTLRNHLTSIYEKLGVTNRLELYVYLNEHEVAD